MFRNTEHFKELSVMSEICPECLSKILGEKYSKYKYILSEDLDICEECGELKRVVVVERKAYILRKLKYIIIPFDFLLRLICLPYFIYIRYKKRQ